MAASVPSAYLGMWRRTLLEQASLVDTSTLVLVIQTEQYHADIRIPSGRPDFSNVESLADCSAGQLRWLATQQGFTGITQVSGNICIWQRDYDYQPSSGQRDIGEMTFAADDIIVETGVEAEYREVWQIMPGSQINLHVHHIVGADRHGVEVPARLFTAGNQFAYVRPRSCALPNAASFLEAIDTVNPDRELLLNWLDFEISFGEIQQPQFGTESNSPEFSRPKLGKPELGRSELGRSELGKIVHSTLPFREQDIMPLM